MGWDRARPEKTKRKSLLLGHDSMNDLAKARNFPNRLLCFNDIMFTCFGKFGEFKPASKLTSTFVLALVKEKSTPLNFL